MHFLSTQATTAFEDARVKVASLINAKAEEVVFTKNATEALNLVAFSWSEANLKPGDEVRLPDSRLHCIRQAVHATMELLTAGEDLGRGEGLASAAVWRGLDGVMPCLLCMLCSELSAKLLLQSLCKASYRAAKGSCIHPGPCHVLLANCATVRPCSVLSVTSDLTVYHR